MSNARLVEHLEDIQEQIESLVREALSLMPEHEKERARSYWHNQMLAALGNCGYESICALDDSIQVLRDEEECEEE